MHPINRPETSRISGRALSAAERKKMHGLFHSRLQCGKHAAVRSACPGSPHTAWPSPEAADWPVCPEAFDRVERFHYNRRTLSADPSAFLRNCGKYAIFHEHKRINCLYFPIPLIDARKKDSRLTPVPNDFVTSVPFVPSASALGPRNLPGHADAASS